MPRRPSSRMMLLTAVLLAEARVLCECLVLERWKLGGLAGVGIGVGVRSSRREPPSASFSATTPFPTPSPTCKHPPVSVRGSLRSWSCVVLSHYLVLHLHSHARRCERLAWKLPTVSFSATALLPICIHLPIGVRSSFELSTALCLATVLCIATAPLPIYIHP